ncbi:MAG: N-6 DNA methylase [Planctomycetes bacterium]|nr:N-6 DNA methylase [Planctomycetota bacterium]
MEIPLVGFATRARDMDSACIAVVDGGSDPIAAVRSCYELAAPVVWVRHNGSAQWWIQKKEPERFEPNFTGDFAALVREHREKLDPISIYQGRTLARFNPVKQLDFVDVGLLPMRRQEAGEKLHNTVESMIEATLKAMGRRSPPPKVVREVFTSVFRMLAAKILKDKWVPGFSSLNLNSPRDLLEAITQHYDTTGEIEPRPSFGYSDLRPAAAILNGPLNFAVVSPESLAYVYEHTLVTKELRKKLGIHATPPWLVDYMVWQLYDWVRAIPEDERHVFEPACGHAPFLLSMVRLLRMEMHDKDDNDVHAYLKDHIHGVEIDDFAREIARLSLTLADIPNPNGWDLQSGDMFASDVLMREAKRCRILLSNPPYEEFNKKDLDRYDAAHRPTQHGKAVEVLHRTIKNLSDAAVFAVVVPQSVLHSTDARATREVLLRDFDFREVCLFADKVFEEGEPESVVIIGRRRKVGETPCSTVKYRRVREDGVSRFKSSYMPDSEADVPVTEFQASADKVMRSPDLPDVWAALRTNPRLSSVADVGQGFSFAKKDLIDEARRLGNRQTADAVRAFIDGHTHIDIWGVPKAIWLSPSRTPISPWRSGARTGQPQIVLNRTRIKRNPWRLKAMLDLEGHALKNNLLCIRPTLTGISPLALWALLNSPVANAFVACDTMKRDNSETLLADLPLPRANLLRELGRLESAAEQYMRLASSRAASTHAAASNKKHSAPLFEAPASVATGPTDAQVREALLVLDAETMRLYSLPAKLERQLFDYFCGKERRGIGCTFGDYYPPNFKSLVPLHKYISAGYRGSTVDQVAARMKPDASSAGTEALRAATEAFGVDQGRPEKFGRALALLDKWTHDNADFDARVSPQIEKALRDTAPRHLPES